MPQQLDQSYRLKFFNYLLKLEQLKKVKYFYKNSFGNEMQFIKMDFLQHLIYLFYSPKRELNYLSRALLITSKSSDKFSMSIVYSSFKQSEYYSIKPKTITIMLSYYQTMQLVLCLRSISFPYKLFHKLLDQVLSIQLQ